MTTDRDNSTIARAAIIGLSESPNVGNRTPAAMEMPSPTVEIVTPWYARTPLCSPNPSHRPSVTTRREGDHMRAIAAMDATRTTGATINITVRPYRVALGNPRSGNS
ncbi:hypothetical protein LGT39_00400, partial [Demequina sp. TTPB684]|nr:hypothetical protein [Demequina sp. TTPB684]